MLTCLAIGIKSANSSSSAVVITFQAPAQKSAFKSDETGLLKAREEISDCSHSQRKRALESMKKVLQQKLEEIADAPESLGVLKSRLEKLNLSSHEVSIPLEQDQAARWVAIT